LTAPSSNFLNSGLGTAECTEKHSPVAYYLAQPISQLTPFTAITSALSWGYSVYWHTVPEGNNTVRRGSSADEEEKGRLQVMQGWGAGNGDKEVDLGEEKGLLVPCFTTLLY
jgi:hypothetical protein